MVRSMIAGVAGLKAHQSKMDVIGNNIANVNTWGFKGFSYNFMDSMYTNSINSSGGNIEAGASGGRNASQVGYGSQLSSISNVFEAGAPSPSANPMDCMIDGTGFFLVGNMVNGTFTNVADSGLFLSRVGIFRVDDNSYLVDDQRSYVYGYALVEGTGIPERPQKAASFNVEGADVTFDQANGTITIAGITVNTTVRNANNMKDAIGDWLEQAPKQADYETKFGECNLEYKNLASLDVAAGTAKANFVITAKQPGAASDAVASAAAGQLTGGTPEQTVYGADLQPGVDAVYSDELSAIRIPIDPETNQRYKLDSYSILEDGTIVGVDEQNRTIAIGQVALIQVQNPNGLEKTTGYYYTIGDNAGNVDHVKPGTGPTGTIKGSYLEMANVDLANEFSNIITTQRGFQANSKIITVTDEMLQELVNMKR